MEDKEQYLAWKRLVPFLYDWLANHHLEWPTLACRWGPIVSENNQSKKQRLYLSEQTDGSSPNKLYVVEAEVCLPRVATAESIAIWADCAPSKSLSKPIHTIIHPGEVNKIMDLPQNSSLIITHTDAPELLVWNIETQQDRTGDSSEKSSKPDLTLTGHKDNAEFAMAVTSSAPLVASGGKDQSVLVWDLEDHMSSTLSAAGTLEARIHLKGHAATVEGISFCPGDSRRLVSVADDRSMLMWDTNTPDGAVLSVVDAHGSYSDLHTVDWSGLQQNHLATGASNGTVRVWDTRKLTDPLKAFQQHSQPVLKVEWCPHTAGVFASAGEDRLLCIWDLSLGQPHQADTVAAKKAKLSTPPELLFQHAGHRAPIVDFQWNIHDPWTLASASDAAGTDGGGTLQVWRVNDIIYRQEEDVLAEMEQYKDFILTGDVGKLTASATPTTTAPHMNNGSGEVNGSVTVVDNKEQQEEMKEVSPPPM